MKSKRVIIVGGGFGGLYAARALRKADAEIVVIDRRNHHLFQPLLYQVATAALNPSDIASPIRSLLHDQTNASVLLGEVVDVDVVRRVVVLTDGEMSYDWLIVAAGATDNYFGHDSWRPPAPGLKTLEDAVEVRRRILFAFEAAERTNDSVEQQAWLTFIVVGGGPTGVELAGALAEVAHTTLARDFRHIDPHRTRIIVVESGKLLSTYPPALQESGKRQLESLGVEVRLGLQVTDIDDHGVSIGGERVEARTVMWAAGVRGAALGAKLGAPVDRAGRVLVTPQLRVPGHDEIFVVGDLASLVVDGKPVPGVAQGAIQGGQYAAAAILAELSGSGDTPRPFHYHDKGSLAVIGRRRGIADLGRIKLSGFLAWMTWLFIHLLFLIGFRNRALVLIEWAWSYLTFQRGARLITGDLHPLLARIKQTRMIETDAAKKSMGSGSGS